MNLTKHAKKRMNQRGISNSILEIVLNLGTFKNAKGEADKIFLGKKEAQNAISNLKKIIQILERAKNTSIITADGKIITVYKSR